MVKHRIVIGAVLLAALFSLFWVDAWLSSRPIGPTDLSGGAVDWVGLACHGGLITAVVALLVLAATVELGRMCQAVGLRPAVGWAALVSVLLAVHPWLGWHVAELEMDKLLLCLLVIGLFGSCLAIMARRHTDGALADVAATWLVAVYVGYLASFAVRIRLEIPGAMGAWCLLYFIAIVKFTDIFAYGTGMLIGRHKLIGWLSPGKTVEGLIGGLAGAAVAAVFLPWLGVIINIVDAQQVEPGTWPLLALMGVLLGGFGQLGDLMESLLKRGAGRKDSGALLPAFGGTLDLLDSPLVAAPVAWLLLAA